MVSQRPLTYIHINSKKDLTTTHPAQPTMTKRKQPYERKELCPYAHFSSKNSTNDTKRVNPEYTKWMKEQRAKKYGAPPKKEEGAATDEKKPA